MDLPLLIGVNALFRKAATHVEQKKNRRAAQEASVSEDNVPRGYAPQKPLLYDFPLEPCEQLIATFEFTPAKWKKDLLASSEMFPHSFGTTIGIGHITSERVLLFYDIDRIHGESTWSGGSIETMGKYGSKIIEHTVNETVGKLFEAFTRIESETREYMEKVAHRHGPYGVVAFPRDGTWGVAFGHVFFNHDSVRHLDGVAPVAFSPTFIDSSGSGHKQNLFRKLIAVGGADVVIEEEDCYPYYGTRSDLARDIF
ncbi:hypothetical protein JX265_003503 [Neoarthrinium moseri]|uniref:Uncharacterized protein n=1 Tax=Neoarthrinium moseri TaxID=1658444 RepID=A0A9P9WSL3_9PEZI|nr:hypothetical protein JX265_003503 [Neoarthrinium moseri]